jgi:hypothetical protein
MWKLEEQNNEYWTVQVISGDNVDPGLPWFYFDDVGQ